MKFTLEIETGNDAMLTYIDLRDALQFVRESMRKYRGRDEALELGDDGPVRDGNGNTVGGWKITGTIGAAVPAEIPAEIRSFLEQVALGNSEYDAISEEAERLLDRN